MKPEIKQWINDAKVYLGLKCPEESLPAGWLSLNLNPSPEFITASRQRLVKRIKEETRRRTANAVTRVLQDPRSLRLALAALLLTILLSGRTFTLASQSAIPGDAFYPVKTAIEHLQLAGTLSRAGDARLRIEFSQRRLQEMESLALEGRFEYLDEAAYDFEIQINSALLLINQIQRTNPALAETLGNSIVLTLTNQTQALAAMQYMVPPHDRDGIEQTLRKSNEGVNAIRRDSNNGNEGEPFS